MRHCRVYINVILTILSFQKALSKTILEKIQELTDEQANRNYDKAIRWIEKGIIPQFLLDDIKEYPKAKPQINNKETLRIGSC